MLSRPDSDSKSDTSPFERNPRRKQELAGRPFADDIYRFVFGPDIEIVRFDNQAILDKLFAIDCQIQLRTGQILLGQEKFLSGKYANFDSVTVEYMQNARERGDWFKLASQIYFVGYLATHGFTSWVIINWPALVLATQRGEVTWRDNANKDGQAQATFKWTKIQELPGECVIASSSKRGYFDGRAFHLP